MQLIVRHGERVIYKDVEDDEGNKHALTIAQTVAYSLGSDGLSFHYALFNKMLQEAAEKSTEPGFKADMYFLHHEDIEVSRMATALVSEEYHVTQPKDEGPQNEEARLQRENNLTDALRNQTEHMLLDFRMDYVESHMRELQTEISRIKGDVTRLKAVMEEYRDMQVLRNALAKQLGNSIVR